MKKPEDLSGKKFGRLFVIARAPNKGTRIAWDCLCDCGKSLVVTTHDLKSGHTKSCGCLQKDILGDIRRTHGKSTSRIYRVYLSMLQRCYCPTSKNYINYGGRGISVCDEWKDNFQAFYDWAMANGYDEKAPRGIYTVERKNVNGNYEPSNCCLADMYVQANNQRKSIFFELQGERLTLSQIARKFNIKQSTLYYRINKQKIPIEKAILSQGV